MFRTQLYITHKANDMLDLMAKKQKRTKAELIREAVDEFLGKYDKGKLQQGFGVWKNYNIDLKEVKNEW